jgi:hypothetical protein
MKKMNSKVVAVVALTIVFVLLFGCFSTVALEIQQQDDERIDEVVRSNRMLLVVPPGSSPTTTDSSSSSSRSVPFIKPNLPIMSRPTIVSSPKKILLPVKLAPKKPL